MIDIVKSMDYLTTSNEDLLKETKYQNMDTSVLEDKRRSTKHDLIFDSFIDAATIQHMSIHTVRQHNATQEAMRRLLCDPNTTSLEIVTSPIDKKRFRLPPREYSNTIQPLLGVLQSNVCNSNVQADQTSTIVVKKKVENDASTYTSKRVKRSNDGSMYKVSMENEEWKFVPYPNHKVMDSTLSRFYGIAQLLTSWDQTLFDNCHEETAILRRTDDVGSGYIDDVEHALLDFHVTSDDWNANNIQPSSNDKKEQHLKSLAIDKNDDVLPFDNSSVSSISFLEQLHVPPPALLRVTTSTILEEQELLWQQIKEEQHEPCPDPLYNINSVWHHEVTRGHHVRPPLSPSIRRGNLSSTTSPSIVAKESENEVMLSNVLAGFKTPTSDERKIKVLASESQTLLSSNASFLMGCHVRPAQITPTKKDHGENVPKSLYALCLGCRTHLHFPLSVTSPVMFCMNCGIIASTDLMRSYTEIDEY